MKNIALSILTLFVISVTVQAEESGVTYIIPDGYKGPLILILKDDAGIRLPPKPKSWTIRFPSSGKLLVQRDTYTPRHPSEKVDETYPSPKAVFESGQEIPMTGEPSDIVFRPLYGVGEGVETGDTSSGAIYFYLGTLKEATEYKNNRTK